MVPMEFVAGALVGAILGSLFMLWSLRGHCSRLEKDNAELRGVIENHALERAFDRPGRMQTDLLPGETPARQPRGMWDN